MLTKQLRTTFYSKLTNKHIYCFYLLEIVWIKYNMYCTLNILTIRRIAPLMVNILWFPVMRPVDESISAKLIWIEAWSLAGMIRLLAELLKNYKMSIKREYWMPCGLRHLRCHDYKQICHHPKNAYHFLGQYKSTNSPASFCILNFISFWIYNSKILDRKKSKKILWK